MSLLATRTLLSQPVTSSTADHIVTLTQAEYDGLPEKDPRTIYLVVE